MFLQENAKCPILKKWPSLHGSTENHSNFYLFYYIFFGGGGTKNTPCKVKQWKCTKMKPLEFGAKKLDKHTSCSPHHSNSLII